MIYVANVMVCAKYVDFTQAVAPKYQNVSVTDTVMTDNGIKIEFAPNGDILNSRTRESIVIFVRDGNMVIAIPWRLGMALKSTMIDNDVVFNTLKIYTLIVNAIMSDSHGTYFASMTSLETWYLRTFDFLCLFGKEPYPDYFVFEEPYNRCIESIPDWFLDAIEIKGTTSIFTSKKNNDRDFKIHQFMKYLKYTPRSIYFMDQLIIELVSKLTKFSECHHELFEPIEYWSVTDKKKSLFLYINKFVILDEYYIPAMSYRETARVPDDVDIPVDRFDGKSTPLSLPGVKLVNITSDNGFFEDTENFQEMEVK